MTDRLRNQLGDWGDVLSPFISNPSFDHIRTQLRVEKSKTIVYPSDDKIFKAFELCQFKDLKVVILGQDPYHRGEAIGICFGIDKEKSKIPPSLRVIVKELQSQYPDIDISKFDYSLYSWAQQGVLLLNTYLTVSKNSPGSHQNMWAWWTADVLKEICLRKCDDVIFILWGKHAQSFSYLIPTCNILKSAHPAAEAYGGGGFFGNNHFLEVNKLLSSKSIPEINWGLHSNLSNL
jgi:uracil-DNA glycosylase